MADGKGHGGQATRSIRLDELTSAKNTCTRTLIDQTINRLETGRPEIEAKLRQTGHWGRIGSRTLDIPFNTADILEANSPQSARSVALCNLGDADPLRISHATKPAVEVTLRGHSETIIDA